MGVLLQWRQQKTDHPRRVGTAARRARQVHSTPLLDSSPSVCPAPLLPSPSHSSLPARARRGNGNGGGRRSRRRLRRRSASYRVRSSYEHSSDPDVRCCPFCLGAPLKRKSCSPHHDGGGRDRPSRMFGRPTPLRQWGCPEAVGNSLGRPIGLPATLGWSGCPAAVGNGRG